MNSYHLRILNKKIAKKNNNKNTHLPSWASMAPGYLDNTPLQGQISSALKVADKTMVVMAEHKNTLHDDQPHQDDLTVLDIHFAEVSVVPDTSMQVYHVQNPSNESCSEIQDSLTPHYQHEVLHPHSHSASDDHHHQNCAIDNVPN